MLFYQLKMLPDERFEDEAMYLWKFVIGPPIRKFLGVNVRMSENISVLEREFIVAPISIQHIPNCSNVSIVVPTVRSRQCLNDLTAASKLPPK